MPACPRCQRDQPSDFRFCAVCGMDLAGLGNELTQRSGDGPAVRSGAIGRSVEIDLAESTALAAGVAAAVQVEPRLSDRSDADPWLGRVIDGRYRVLAKLGQGGMGAVYRVEHQHMGKVAAMKVLHRELASEPEIVQRFKREAEAVSRLNHANTVQTFDFGSYDGALYLVMEYVRGEDLGAILKRDGALPFHRVAPIFEQICAALTEAHELGIIHRDLKPENVLVTRSKDGREIVKVVDFGLAKVREREDANEVTGRGNLLGTPYYMSPEQIRSDPVDARTDIYSLGAMMYRVLTSEPPFSAPAPIAVLTKHLTEDLVPPSVRRPDLAIAPQVDAIVARAMAKAREDRFANIELMRAALATARQELGPGTGSGTFSGTFSSSPSSPSSPSSSDDEPILLRRRSDRTDGAGAASDRAPAHKQGGTRGWAGAPLEDDGGDGGDDADADEDSEAGRRGQLRRADLDEFERSLRRRGRMRLVLLPLLLVILGLGAVLGLRWWQRRPRAFETEPNNDTVHAHRLRSGDTVAGHLRGRIDREIGDADVFHIPSAKADGVRVLQAELTGIPNIDLQLDVVDGTGATIVRSDATGVGGRELIPNLRLPGGDVYLVVHETLIAGKFPTENSEDAYHLNTTWGEAVPHEESEPNDEAAPLELALGDEVAGYLGQPGDTDAFRLSGDGSGKLGKLVVEVSGIEGVDMTVRVGSTSADQNGPGRGERLEMNWPAGAQPPAIVVVTRKDPEGRPPEREARGQRIVGLDLHYRLRATLP